MKHSMGMTHDTNNRMACAWLISDGVQASSDFTTFSNTNKEAMVTNTTNSTRAPNIAVFAWYRVLMSIKFKAITANMTAEK